MLGKVANPVLPDMVFGILVDARMRDEAIMSGCFAYVALLV